MKRKKVVDSRDTGLEIGLILGKFFLGLEHLHFGYWPEGMPVIISQLPKAQSLYLDFLVEHIPDGIKSILDVGCGAGRNAKKLLDMGYIVDCVSPSKKLTSHARTLLNENVTIYEDKFENITMERRYEMMLFSESYQYINLEKTFLKSRELLHPQGYVLICDFFKTDAIGKSSLRGGHSLAEFYKMVEKHGFTIKEDIDITERTAPNLTIVDDMLTQAGLPIWNSIMEYLTSSYPLISKILMWKYRKKLNKINNKYFSGSRNSVTFAKFKSYRLFVLQCNETPV